DESERSSDELDVSLNSFNTGFEEGDSLDVDTIPVKDDSNLELPFNFSEDPKGVTNVSEMSENTPKGSKEMPRPKSAEAVLHSGTSDKDKAKETKQEKPNFALNRSYELQRLNSQERNVTLSSQQSESKSDLNISAEDRKKLMNMEKSLDKSQASFKSESNDMYEDVRS